MDSTISPARANPYQSGPFRDVADMENRLRVIRDLLTGLTYLGEGVVDAGSAIITIAEVARDECAAVEELRCKLFRELHPRKAELDREGWPTDDPVSRYWQAHDAYNAGSIHEPEYQAALKALDAWQPTTPLDFVRKYAAVYVDDASPNKKRSGLFMHQAAAILGGQREGGEA